MEAVIVEAARTPFARQAGAYRETRPDTLLAHALTGLLDRSGLEPARLDDIVVGCVTQVGEQGGNIARLASLLAGIPVTVPAVSQNRWCGSGQQAIHAAAQEVLAGDSDFVIAAGVESMTRAPLFSDLGGLDKLNRDLTRRHELVHQGESGERIAEKWGIGRDEMDRFGIESHRRASLAARQGFHGEILPTRGLDPAGTPIDLARDEGIRDTIDPAKVASLAPAFRPQGTGRITAANASQVADGAAAVLVANREAARAAGLKPKARILARVAIGDDPTLSLTGVIPATTKALKRTGLTLRDLDWIEINEAFASVVLAWAREHEPDMEKVNPWGGAIAHGHPLGATGPGLMSKLLAGLERTGGTLGLLTICIGFGQATATIVERI